MVIVATLRLGSARVYLHTAFALEMAIKTLDRRPAAMTSTSRVQQRTIEQIVDVLVPPEVAKIIRVVLAVTQRDHTRTPTSDATYAAFAPIIEHVTYATPVRMENVPQIFKEMASPAKPAPMMETVASAPVVTHDGPFPVTTTLAPVIENMATAPAVICDGPLPVIEYMASTTPCPVIENLATSPAVTCVDPLPVVGHVAPTTPSPVIENMAFSSAITNDGPRTVVGYVEPAAPAPVIDNVDISSVNEFMAPALGISDVVFDSEIEDFTRCLDELKKQVSCHPTLFDLENRLAALRQARGY